MMNVLSLSAHLFNNLNKLKWFENIVKAVVQSLDGDTHRWIITTASTSADTSTHTKFTCSILIVTVSRIALAIE